MCGCEDTKMTFLDVIGWLRGVENLAHQVYSDASKTKGLSPDLSSFLEQLAEDESLHYHLMGSAAELIRSQGESPASAIMVDQEADARIMGSLRQLQDKIASGNLTEDNILNAIVAIETTELNGIFLYVIEKCAEISSEFQYMVASIQAHEKRIEEFLQSKDIYLVGKMKALPEIWKINLLVVEDDPLVLKLLERIVSKFGRVITAENGAVALSEIEKQFFNVIITDVKMPVMDGLSLLKQATEKQPHLASQFIICTAHPSPDVMDTAKAYQVPILQKPVSINSLWEAVQQILSASL